MPIIIEDIGDTYPDAGVIATKLATAPDAAPIVEGRPVWAHETSAHVTAAIAVAVWVATNALVAFDRAAPAEPALKPNQPTHSKAAPRTMSDMLCGSIGIFPYPSLRPNIRAMTRPDQPDVIWITVPPAKSRDGSAPVQPTCVPPEPNDHVQWAQKS